MEVSSYEVKTKFAEMLRRVEAGESITVTRRGVPVATLNPFKSRRDAEKIRQAAADIHALRARLNLRGITWENVKTWRDEGRR
ncbi:MAG: type II toxin-antitoxin system prevent-host-death family antitoxin [Alphaproteobacteria bacterium]